jgi:hypothetical protein
MTPEEWERLAPGEDCRWGDTLESVVLAPPPGLRGRVVGGWRVANNPPPDLVAKAKTQRGSLSAGAVELGAISPH